MTAVEPIPFRSERGEALKKQIIPFLNIEPCLDANYLVSGWLGAGGLSVLFGPSNTGKTFIAVDLAAHVASGKGWRGCKVRKGPVVYVAAEGGGGIRNRIAAIRQTRPRFESDTQLFLLPTHLDLHSSADAVALCEAMPFDQAALIVVDTLARNMGPGDENSARDMAQFIASLDLIRERSKAHVLVVHHSGKNADAGARGSSALRAAVDTEIAVTDGQITCAKQRDMEIPQRLFFSLETVPLGEDRDGDPVTSAVVVSADAPPAKQKPLAGRDEVAAQALVEALRLHGQKRVSENIPANRKSVELSKWREQCLVNGLTDAEASVDAKRKAFTRARERLLDCNHIRIWGQYVWKVAEDD